MSIDFHMYSRNKKKRIYTRLFIDRISPNYIFRNKQIMNSFASNNMNKYFQAIGIK